MNGSVAFLQQRGATVKSGNNPLTANATSEQGFANKLQSLLGEASSNNQELQTLQKQLKVLLNKEVKLSEMGKELKEVIDHLKALVESLPEGVSALNQGNVPSQMRTLSNNDNIKSFINSIEKALVNEADSFVDNNMGEKLEVLQGWLSDLKSILEPKLSQNDVQEQLSAMSLSMPQSITYSRNAAEPGESNLSVSGNVEKVATDLKRLLQNLSTVMTGNKEHTSLQISKQMKELYSIAEQLIKIEKSSQASTEVKQLLQQLKQDTTSPKAFASFEQALMNLRRRSNLSLNNKYSQNAKVTSTEFGKWMENSWSRLGEFSETKKEPSLKTIGFSSTGDGMMTKQEQMVIKLSPNRQSDQSMPKQLIEEFQKIMNRSRFNMNKVGSQLSIKLNPGSLGDMMVKMTQQNGEMMVKIMVSTQAAKEMLEGNLNQLRHMFTPSQVQIEKQDLTTQTDQSFTFEKDEDQQQEKDRQHEQSTETASEEDDESLSFHDVLMNEKV
ncbi:flagellar hook-length control protein FliK [Pontibacillus sp. ALD_SL1]|uniref:flagellar hook-length control protein FliK n=1 Tax=Pontibacillus sp. ALD_SL1 TaxID=2777185 RepID=UPI001A97185D|nr:flagellar hook-length control protein FliK [Pontibacillus sp. ALD_SL1]QST01587.1 flagellar hook-length control protein FliK [Pontibacillus sp. ALD_SL1]